MRQRKWSLRADPGPARWNCRANCASYVNKVAHSGTSEFPRAGRFLFQPETVVSSLTRSGGRPASPSLTSEIRGDAAVLPVAVADGIRPHAAADLLRPVFRPVCCFRLVIRLDVALPPAPGCLFQSAGSRWRQLTRRFDGICRRAIVFRHGFALAGWRTDRCLYIMRALVTAGNRAFSQEWPCR